MAGEMVQLAKTRIGKAICEGKIRELQKCLGEEDFLFRDRKDNTYLHYVCTMHRPHIINILLTTTIDVNAQNRHGNTALHVTALHNECSHIADLMAAGIDPSIRNKEGNTAGDLKTKNKFWHSIYNKYQSGTFKAVAEHNVERLLELLHCWCKVDSVRNGQTLRQFAAALKYHDIVFLLDDHKATLDAIYGVLEVNKSKLRGALKKSKCNINYLNHAASRQHILQYAMRLHDVDFVSMICDAGANVNLSVSVNSYFQGPLYFEAINNKLPGEIVWKVLKSKCDFSLKDERGRTCMMFALDKTNGTMPLDVIEYMLKKGTDIAERDETGATVRDVARFARRRDVVDLLDKFYVKKMRASDIPGLRKLAVDGYDSMLIQHNYRDTYIYACGNETSEVLEFVTWLPQFQKTVQLLHKSIRESNLSLVKQLLAETENSPQMLCNAKDKGCRSPLHLAILFENYDIADFLLSLPDVDISTKDCHHQTVYHYACALPTAGHIRCQLEARGVDVSLRDCTLKQGKDFTTSGETVADWVLAARKVSLGTELELLCIDKYEELRKIIKNKKKGMPDFLDAIKYFKQYPVVEFPQLLSPLMPDYKDLIFLALDYDKPDIARRLADLGADLTQIELFVIGFDEETDSEDDESDVCSSIQPDVRLEVEMNPAERARFLGYPDLAIHMEKKLQRKSAHRRPGLTAFEQIHQQFSSVFITQAM